MARTRLRRLITWTIAAAAAGAAVVWALRRQPVPVDVGLVTRGPLRVTLDQEGRTRVRHRYVVSSPAAGRLLRIGLEPGDRVIRGQTEVAVLLPDAPPLLDARTRAMAEARVKAAAAGVTQARALLGQAESARDLAVRERDRMKRLFAGQAVSASDMEQAEAAAHSSEQAVQGARAGVVAAQHELDVTTAALTSAAGAAGGGREAITIRAPIDGVLLKRFHESASVVPPGEPLVEIADTADLEIVADYLSSDAVRIRSGMPVAIDRWGGGDALEGRVRLVEPSGFLKVSALGVEEQRVNVIISFEDPRTAWDALGDGYRVEVRTVIWEQTGVLKAPTGALFRDGDRWAAYLLDNGVARLRLVDVGRQTGLETQVVSGLEENDRVIVHPSDRVAEGVKVKVRS